MKKPAIKTRYLVITGISLVGIGLTFGQLDLETVANPLTVPSTASKPTHLQVLTPPDPLTVPEVLELSQNRLTQNQSDYPNVMGQFYEAIEVIEEPESLTVFVNKNHQLPASYVPKDLVLPQIKAYQSDTNQSIYLRKEAAQAAERMFEGAKQAGYELIARSGYRSYDLQAQIYQSYLNQYGLAYTNLISAKPGHSEHQTGLALDITARSNGSQLNQPLAKTNEGKWLAEHAHEYGFILRYPEGREADTGYTFEPWHFRYVGEELAAFLTERGLLFEEYILIYQR